jgi:hypothetical protein
MAANKFNVGYLRSIAVRLSKMQYQELVTLCWRSLWDMVTILLQAVLTSKAADSSMIDQVCRTARWSSKMQGLKSLRLCWRSFVEHCEDVQRIFA